MNALKSKLRRLTPTILPFLLSSYDINAGLRQPTIKTGRSSTLSVPEQFEHVLAILFTRLDKTHLSKGENKVKLKTDEIDRLNKITGLSYGEINDALRLANSLRQNGKREQPAIEGKASDILGKYYYSLLKSFGANSSFNALVEFIQSENSPFSITITPTT